MHVVASNAQRVNPNRLSKISSRNKSGSEIIWCVSKGRCVTGRSDATIGAAVERLGTNEVPIHHVNVNPIRFRFGDPLAKRASFQRSLR